MARPGLVKIAACGVCHTDLHPVRGDWPIKPNLPLWRPDLNQMASGKSGAVHIAMAETDD